MEELAPAFKQGVQSSFRRLRGYDAYWPMSWLLTHDAYWPMSWLLTHDCRQAAKEVW